MPKGKLYVDGRLRPPTNLLSKLKDLCMMANIQIAAGHNKAK